MQVNFNPQYTNRNFGMSLHADTFAKNALRVRVSKNVDWKAINDLISAQEKNTVAHIGLSSSSDSPRLSGWIHADGKTEKYYEGLIYDFSNPVTFIKALCDRADAIARELSGDTTNPTDVLKRLG